MEENPHTSHPPSRLNTAWVVSATGFVLIVSALADYWLVYYSHPETPLTPQTQMFGIAIFLAQSVTGIVYYWWFIRRHLK